MEESLINRLIKSLACLFLSSSPVCVSILFSASFRVQSSPPHLLLCSSYSPLLPLHLVFIVGLLLSSWTYELIKSIIPMCVFVGPRSCLSAAGCCGASGDTAFDAASGPDYMHDFTWEKIPLFVFMLVCLWVFTWLLWGIPYKASTRSAALFKITSYNQAQKEEGDWSRVWRLKEFSHFYYISRLTLCCECRTESAREEVGRWRKGEEEKWACPGTLLLAGQFGRAEVRYCYLWIKHEPISLYQSTILCVLSSLLSPPDHESNAHDHTSISFNTTYHQVDGYTTPLVSWDTPVSCPVLTLVMIQVNSPASTLCDKCRTSLLRWKPPSGISHIKHLSFRSVAFSPRSFSIAYPPFSPLCLYSFPSLSVWVCDSRQSLCVCVM